MFLVPLFLTLCLHGVNCPGWQPRKGLRTHGGGGCTTLSPDFLPGAPGANSGGNSGGTSPRTPPLREAPGTGLPGRLEGVYTPTVHKGGPVRGNGPGSSLGDGCTLGGGEGLHTAVAGLTVQQGAQPPRRCGSPSSPADRRASRRTPLPPGLPPRRAGACGAGATTAC